MVKPGDNDEILLVAILRFLKKTQDEVAEILSIGKRKVVAIEDWIRAEPLAVVEGLFIDYRLKKVIEDTLSDIPDIEPRDLVRAARIAADDVLQHYRKDYSPSIKPPMEEPSAHPLLLPGNQIAERYSEHWARLGRVAEALKIGLEYPKYREGDRVSSRYGGTVWGNWSFSMVQFKGSKFIESPEIHFSAENNDLWSYLMKHMDDEFPGFIVDFKKFKEIAVGRLKESSQETNREDPWLREHPMNLKLREKLWLVIERGTFKGSCDICKDLN